MLPETIGDVCMRACSLYGVHHADTFYERYSHLIDYPEVDIDSPLITDIVIPKGMELDEKAHSAALGVFENGLTMIHDTSGRMMDVISTVLNTSMGNGERVLIVVSDPDHANGFMSSIDGMFLKNIRHIRSEDLNTGHMGNLDVIDIEGELESRIIEDSKVRVAKYLQQMAYDDIMESVNGFNIMMISKSDLLEHMSPIEGDDRLHPDFDRILVFGAERFDIVDTMPLYTFNRPIAFLYMSSDNDTSISPEGHDPIDIFPLALSSRYSESMLFNTPSQMAEHVRNGSEPQLWKSVEYHV